MFKRTLSVLLMTLLLLGLLAGCDNSSTISGEEVQKIVLEDLGASADEVQIHLHVGEYAGEPCFSAYVTYKGETLEYLIDGTSGEILAVNKSNHSH